jgi:molybdate transport system substrate-binding protein
VRQVTTFRTTRFARLTCALLAGAAVTLATGCGDTGDDRAGSGAPSGGANSGNSGNSGKTVVVFAAASLTETFTVLGKTFQTAHPGVRVKFNFGGSSALAQQIAQGAPADVFAAASPATMKTVIDAHLAAGRPSTFVRNRLEIAVPPDNPGKITGLKDLTNSKVKVVLCAPQVPCGAAAGKALNVAGLTVEPVSQEQDVKAALTKVELGEADAALVYRTDVKAAAGKVKGIDFPEAVNAVNDYPIAAIAEAPQPALASQFVQLVLSRQGKAVLTRAGFEAPGP